MANKVDPALLETVVHLVISVLSDPLAQLETPVPRELEEKLVHLVAMDPQESRFVEVQRDLTTRIVF